MKRDIVFIQNRIIKFLEMNNWTKYRLAIEAELSYSTINNIFVRGSVPSITHMLAICGAFGIYLSEFFMDNKVTSNSELSKQEKALIAGFRSSDKETQEMISRLMYKITGIK